jgi:hypothetical protein
VSAFEIILKRDFMDLSDKRAFIVGLLVKCPYQLDPIDCIFHDLRRNSLKEITEFSKRLSEKEVQEMVVLHQKCLSQREGK